MLIMRINVSVQNHDSPKLQEITSEKAEIKLLVHSKRYHVEKLSIPILHWSLDGPEIPELFLIRAQFDFGTRVSPKQLADSFHSRS